MMLQVLLPTHRLINAQIQKVTAESEIGSFTLLPRHIDFVTTIEPGLLAFTDTEGKTVHLAVDEGILVKRGDDVFVSVNRAVRGDDLRSLQETVEREFRELDERERKTRAALAGLEADLIRRFVELGARAP